MCYYTQNNYKEEEYDDDEKKSTHTRFTIVFAMYDIRLTLSIDRNIKKDVLHHSNSIHLILKQLFYTQNKNLKRKLQIQHRDISLNLALISVIKRRKKNVRS